MRTLLAASTGPPFTGVDEGKTGGGPPKRVDELVAWVLWVSRALLCE